MAKELNARQIDRQDEVDNAIHTLLEELAGKELAHDISLIGEKRDVIAAEFDQRGIMAEMEFYPLIETKVYRHKKWCIEEYEEGKCVVPTSEVSNAIVFSGTLAECKAWINVNEKADKQEYLNVFRQELEEESDA